MENKLKLQNGSHNDQVSFLQSTLKELRNVTQKLKNNTVPYLTMETNGRIGWLTNVKISRMKMSCSKNKLRIESQPNAPCSSFITRFTMRGGYSFMFIYHFSKPLRCFIWWKSKIYSWKCDKQRNPTPCNWKQWKEKWYRYKFWCKAWHGLG